MLPCWNSVYVDIEGFIVYEDTSHSSNIKTMKSYATQRLYFVVNLTREFGYKPQISLPKHIWDKFVPKL